MIDLTPETQSGGGTVGSDSSVIKEKITRTITEEVTYVKVEEA